MIESTSICLINGSVFRDIEVPYKVQIDSAKVILQSGILTQQEFTCNIVDNIVQVRVLPQHTTQYTNKVVKLLVIGESVTGFKEIIHQEMLSFSLNI